MTHKVLVYVEVRNGKLKSTAGECLTESLKMLGGLNENLHAVQTLLQNLLQHNAITKELYDKLYPKINQLELAHFHGLPKVHKVNH